jgi:hypothetical protein
VHRATLPPRLVLSSLILLATVAVTARAQSSDSSALINQALDKQYRLELPTHTPLGRVMERITADTGVPIRIDPAVFELLPWGTDSSVKVEIRNQTLRQALSAMTQKFALTWAVGEQEVEIRPSPALRRLDRRATLDELAVLDLLASTPAGLDTDRPTVDALLSAVDARLEAAKSPFAVENRGFDGERGATTVPVARNATLAEALESLHEATGATWYPWGKTVLIEPKQSQVRRQLQKRISVRYDGEELSQVLLELSERSGVPFQIEPGAVQRVNPEYRRLRGLILDNVPVQQALETISGVTGLGYVVNERGVYLWNQNPNPATAGGAGTAAAPREPAAGLLTLDNGMQVIIPQSQVPEDLRDYLKAQTTKKFENIRQQMKEEGFKPAAPATQPTTTKVDEDL